MSDKIIIISEDLNFAVKIKTAIQDNFPINTEMMPDMDNFFSYDNHENEFKMVIIDMLTNYNDKIGIILNNINKINIISRPCLLIRSPLNEDIIREYTRFSGIDIIENYDNDNIMLPLIIHKSKMMMAIYENNKQLKREIEERHRIEALMSNNNDKYRSLIEAAHEAYIILDENFNIIEYNTPFVKIFSIKNLYGVLGSNPSKWILPGSMALFNESKQKLVSNMPVKDFEIGCLSENNQLVWITIDAIMISNGSTKYIFIIKDITGKKKLQIESYIDAQKQKDKLRQNIVDVKRKLKTIIEGANV